MKIQNVLIFAATAAFITSASASVTMDWVIVGNPGNTSDTLTGHGAVAYEYKIGKYEVTNIQYGEFLNAKGASNNGGIYNSSMSAYGITQVGSSGSFTYSVTNALANHPVVYVSWFDAARFANWMINGQGSGDMETGAYSLNGATSGIIAANIGAQIYIPTEDEWYKSAYYNAANSTYWLYPNSKNSITVEEANYYESSGTTDVGSYSEAESSYGTSDQGGNVWEWNDAVIHESQRRITGGSYLNGGFGLYAGDSYSVDPTGEGKSIGFRLASVPEPTSMLLTMFTGGMMLIRRKR